MEDLGSTDREAGRGGVSLERASSAGPGAAAGLQVRDQDLPSGPAWGPQQLLGKAPAFSSLDKGGQQEGWAWPCGVWRPALWAQTQGKPGC